LPTIKEAALEANTLKNVNIVDIKRNVTMIEQMLLPLDLENAFISILLNVSDIKAEEDSDIDKLKNFNVDV